MTVQDKILNPTALALLRLWDVKGERPDEEVEVETSFGGEEVSVLRGRVQCAAFKDATSVLLEIKPNSTYSFDPKTSAVTEIEGSVLTIPQEWIRSVQVIPPVKVDKLQKKITAEHGELNGEYPLLVHAQAIGLFALACLASSYM